tara:strand:+ start:169 stop:1473 length:1305 start_codon:yes stop_codon:yes gene_type:complete
MTTKITILFFLIVQCIYPQTKTQSILVGGTAHIGNGQTIENCVIIIKDGKIEKIGSEDTLYFDKTKYNIINTENKHIYPSLILPNTTLGLAEIDAVRASRDEREVGLINSNVRSQVAFNTESIVVSTVRSNGILLAQATPRGGLISGSSSIMKLEGKNWKDATYFQDDGIHINWPEDYHRNHWTHSHDFTAKDKEIEKEDMAKKKNKKSIAKLYEFFDNAIQYNIITKQKLDLKFEALKSVFEGNSSLYIHANTVDGIKESILFAKQFNIKKIVIVGGSESWRITDFIIEHKIPIILDRIHRLPGNEDDDIDQPFKTPKILRDAGILFCLDYKGDMERMGSRNLPFLAGTTVNYGFSKEEALQLVTLNASKILGISNRTGSLEKGKDANLCISSGDILDVLSNNIELAFLMGEKINLSNHQTHLYEKYLKKDAK